LIHVENHLPIVVFNMNQPGAITKALIGEPIGTVVRDAGKAMVK